MAAKGLIVIMILNAAAALVAHHAHAAAATEAGAGVAADAAGKMMVLKETCRCGGSQKVLCRMEKDIVSTTVASPQDPARAYFVRVLNNCAHCSARWVAVEGDAPGYPTLVKGGQPLNPWEFVELGPLSGTPRHHPPTQANFDCLTHPSP